MNINIEKDIKIVLLGDSGVGKSSIVLRFITNEFRPFFETTLGAAFTQKTYEYRPNIFYKFCMWDTAGQEKYHSLTHMYYRDAQVAILVFDSQQKSTFQGVQKWVQELRNHVNGNIIIAIVANKIDAGLDGNCEQTTNHHQMVDLEMAKDYAKQIQAIFNQTSAKTGEGIHQLFNDISHQIYQNELNQRERFYSRERQRLQHQTNQINKKKCQC